MREQRAGDRGQRGPGLGTLQQVHVLLFEGGVKQLSVISYQLSVISYQLSVTHTLAAGRATLGLLEPPVRIDHAKRVVLVVVHPQVRIQRELGWERLLGKHGLPPYSIRDSEKERLRPADCFNPRAHAQPGLAALLQPAIRSIDHCTRSARKPANGPISMSMLARSSAVR